MKQEKPPVINNRDQTDQPNPRKSSQTFKFNISFDTLRPFVQTARTPPKPTNYAPLLSHRVRPSSRTEQSQDIPELKRVRSPDVIRESSNSILRAIETKGIGCAWDDIEEVRSEYKQGEEEGASTWRESVWSDPPVSKNQSIASTNDQFSGYYPEMYRPNYQVFTYTQRYYDPRQFVIDVQRIGCDPRTTLMIKNIPNKYTIQSLSEEIDKEFANCYDFLYLPCDIKNNCNQGYGFINLISTQLLTSFYDRFHNKRWSKFRSEKICNLTYARLQGLSSLIDHFQNSKVLNHKDKKYQPIIRQQLQVIDSLIESQKATYLPYNL